MIQITFVEYVSLLFGVFSLGIVLVCLVPPHNAELGAIAFGVVAVVSLGIALVLIYIRERKEKSENTSLHHQGK